MLSVAQVAKKLGISDGVVYGWCQSGRMPHLRLGGKSKRGCIRIAETDLDTFLATCRQGPRQEEPAPAQPQSKSQKSDEFSAYYQRIMDEVARKPRRR